MARIDKKRALMETFGYDELDRLTDIWLNGAHTGLMTYDALGRMTGKMADRQQVFGNAQYGYTGPDGQLRPHAVSSAETGYNPFPTDQLDVDYTMFDKVLSIARTPNPYCFDYGYDHQRIRMHDGANYEKIYVGGCEFVSTSSGLASMASGGKFWQGFATGAVSSFVSSATAGICGLCEVPEGWTKAAVVAAGCLSGDVTATMAGGNFWEGVCSGLICAGLNHAMHLVVDGGFKLAQHLHKYIHAPYQIGDHDCKYAVMEGLAKYYGVYDMTQEDFKALGEGFIQSFPELNLTQLFTLCGFSVVGAATDLNVVIEGLDCHDYPAAMCYKPDDFSYHEAILTGLLKNENGVIMYQVSDPIFGDNHPVNPNKVWNIIQVFGYSKTPPLVDSSIGHDFIY